MSRPNIKPCGENRETPVSTVFVDNFYYHRTNQSFSIEVVPHLGLMTLATLLEQAGHRAEVFDPKILFGHGGFAVPDSRFLDAWAQALLDRKADIIGFTAYGRSLPYVIRVAERIKLAAPHQIVILGGPHATIVGDKVLREFDCLDLVVHFEAELIIADLVERLRDGRPVDDVPSLSYRRDGEVLTSAPLTSLPEMDEIPIPTLRFYPMEELRLAELSVEAGRGCPFACTFCSTANFFQRRYRLKSNRRMIAEMEALRERYSISIFNLNHDLFGLKKKSLREFCEMIRDRGFQWKCSMRSDTLDSEILEQLRRAGCQHIYFGIETGSPRLQKVIEKNLDLDATRLTLGRVVASNITCTVSFITGFPEETEVDQDLTLDMIGDLLRIDPRRIRPQLHLLSPEPGSTLSESATEFLFDGIGPEADELIDEELVRRHPDIFSVFYHYGTVTPRWRHILASSFVTFLLPELGYPLTTYICSNFFSGRLSRFFSAMVPEEPQIPLTFENILRLLREGTDSFVRKVAFRAPYIMDLVRFSRIVSILDRRPPNDMTRTYGDGGTSNEELAPAMWLARFDCDVQALVNAILERPAAAIDDALTVAVERWCLMYLDQSDKTVITNLDPDVGRQLDLLSGTKIVSREDAMIYRQLGIKLVEC